MNNIINHKLQNIVNIISVYNFDLDSDSSDTQNSSDNSDVIIETSSQFPCTSNGNENLSSDTGPPKMKRTKKEMSPRLSAVLEKCKISDRDAVHLLTAFLDPGE